MRIQPVNMSKAELNETIVAYQNGDESKVEDIFKAVYKYIVGKANDYAFSGSATVDELVSSGYLMMIRALRDYEPSRGYNFITYFKDWLKKGLKRESCFANSSVYIHENYWRNVCTSVNEEIGEDVTLEDTLEGDIGVKADIASDYTVLKDALKELNDVERQVVELVELKGYRLTEVAEKRNSTRQAVNGIHKNAMKKLRNYMKNLEK